MRLRLNLDLLYATAKHLPNVTKALQDTHIKARWERITIRPNCLYSFNQVLNSSNAKVHRFQLGPRKIEGDLETAGAQRHHLQAAFLKNLLRLPPRPTAVQLSRQHSPDAFNRRLDMLS